MLAQNFKTPAELGISDAEFNALAKVLGMLERGELTHGHGPQMLDMNLTHVKSFCGTVCCIGGWVGLTIGHEDADQYVKGYMKEGALHELYWSLLPTSGTTPDQAAIALRNYLTTGEPRWSEALAQ